MLLLRDVPAPLPPLAATAALAPPAAAGPQDAGLLRPLSAPGLLAKPLAAAAFAAADSGRKKCRWPARVSTRCPRCHRLQPLSHRSIVPCLRQGEAGGEAGTQDQQSSLRGGAAGNMLSLLL